jgi:hypothetical protein
VILQPQFRTEHLANWSEAYTPEVVNAAKDDAAKFWGEYQRAMAAQSPQPPQQKPSSSNNKPQPKSRPPVSLLATKLHALSVTPPRPQDEYTDYLSSNLEFEKAKFDQIKSSSDNRRSRISYTIEWWYQQRQRWPILARFAIEILSIAAMSDDVERVFSGGRRTISWERSRLGLHTVEATECLGSWFPLNLESLQGDQMEEENETE